MKMGRDRRNKITPRQAINLVVMTTTVILAATIVAAPVRAQPGPVVNQVAKLLALDGSTQDIFGSSISISGDTIVVGARWDDDACFPANINCNSGSAYVYVRDPATGVWMQQAKLIAAETLFADEFGDSAVISGDTIVVGARRGDGVVFNSGAAYVFVRNPSTGVWTQQATLFASDGATDDYFGFSLAISGDTVVVGSRFSFINGVQSVGSAYVFVRNPSTGVWTQQAKLTASDGVLFDNFGVSVSVSGDTSVIGAFTADANGLTNSGAAYAFTRNAAGVWTQQAKLIPLDGGLGNLFGNSVSLIGSTAVIGARSSSVNGVPSGSAYVFTRNAAGVWTQQAKLAPSDVTAGNEFGGDVTTDGVNIVVGSRFNIGNGATSGSAYLFSQNGAGVWTQHAKFAPSDGASDDRFGVFVTISGATVAVASWLDDDLGASSGSAYTFNVPAQGNPADFNGDGFVNAADLATLLAQWGPCPPPPGVCAADLNTDGSVNAADLATLLANWG